MLLKRENIYILDNFLNTWDLIRYVYKEGVKLSEFYVVLVFYILW